MAYYGHCESYFVEGHEDNQRRFREEMRERERFANQQIQRELGADLSKLTSYEYGPEILQHMEKVEVRRSSRSCSNFNMLTCVIQAETLPDVASIDIQTEIQWFMRPYLLDFLIEAHTAFGLLPETMFLTVNLLDRYCSRRIVYKKHYQLVGCSALLIASKFGDRKDNVPTMKELNSMCCGLYDDDMFIQMEWHVLQTLDWNVNHPSIDHFLKIAMEHQSPDLEVEHMACYIAEIALFQKEFVGKKPSDMARSALVLARCILQRSQGSTTDWALRYDTQTLVTLSQQLHRPSSILSRKYATAHLSRVSIILDDFLARQASIVKTYNAPPTPPSDKSRFNEQFDHATPSKQQFLPTPNNGCPTPPITPTNQEYFNAHKKDFDSVGQPSPPRMDNHMLYSSYSPGPCYLPPITQMASVF